MLKKLFIIGITSLLFLPIAKSQQAVNYTMFMFNKLAINPAYAGSVGTLRASGHYRNQWTSFDGAPKNFTISAHSPIFSKRMGGGVTFTSDKIGIVHEYIADFAYAYRIPFDDKGSLSIGLSGMVQYKRINWNESNPLHDIDPELSNIPSSRTNPNFGFGAYYMSKDFYAGVSIPRLFRSTFYNYTSNEDLSLSAVRTIYLMGGMVKKINNNVKFQPGVLITVNKETPFEIDANASLVFIDKVWVGLSYRLNDSVNAIFQLQLTDQLKAAAAIDFTLSELQKYAPGSFELMAQYTMVKSAGNVENIRFF